MSERIQWGLLLLAAGFWFAIIIYRFCVGSNARSKKAIAMRRLRSMLIIVLGLCVPSITWIAVLLVGCGKLLEYPAVGSSSGQIASDLLAYGVGNLPSFLVLALFVDAYGRELGLGRKLGGQAGVCWGVAVWILCASAFMNFSMQKSILCESHPSSTGPLALVWANLYGVLGAPEAAILGWLLEKGLVKMFPRGSERESGSANK